MNSYMHLWVCLKEGIHVDYSGADTPTAPSFPLLAIRRSAIGVKNESAVMY